jgi:hypothetical protein
MAGSKQRGALNDTKKKINSMIFVALPIFFFVFCAAWVEGNSLAAAAGLGPRQGEPVRIIAISERLANMQRVTSQRRLLGGFLKDEVCDATSDTDPVFEAEGEEDALVVYELQSDEVEDDEVYLFDYASEVFCR